MAVIFAVVGGGAVIGIATSDTHSDYSDYSDYYNNYSDYSDAAVRRERRRKELNSVLSLEKNSVEEFIDSDLRKYLKGTSYAYKSAEQILDSNTNNINESVYTAIKKEFDLKNDKETGTIKKEIEEIDLMLKVIENIEKTVK